MQDIHDETERKNESTHEDHVHKIYNITEIFTAEPTTTAYILPCNKIL